jgi:hypothetical protein
MVASLQGGAAADKPVQPNVLEAAPVSTGVERTLVGVTRRFV